MTVSCPAPEEEKPKPVLERGWGWPAKSKKAHFFLANDQKSLCGKWLYWGPREDTTHESPDNCAGCKKSRAKLALSW